MVQPAARIIDKTDQARYLISLYVNQESSRDELIRLTQVIDLLLEQMQCQSQELMIALQELNIPL